MEMNPYIVYVRTNEKGYIVSVNSSGFLSDASGWTEIDRGYTQRHHHAQGNYFPQPIMDERGVYRYKMADGKPAERTAEEMDADYTPQEQRPTTEQRVDALETTTDDIILMMAELIGG